MPLRWSREGIGERFTIDIVLLAEPDNRDRVWQMSNLQAPFSKSW
jgi:hypothetical protein